MAPSQLAARLKSDVIAAMKAKEKERLGVLRMLQAALKQVEVDERKELDDQDVIRIFSSYARKVREQIKSFGDGGRGDLRDAAEFELKIVSGYLPAELEAEELEALVRAAVAEAGATSPRDMGKVMKVIMPKVAGRADGSRVSDMVKNILGS